LPLKSLVDQKLPQLVTGSTVECLRTVPSDQLIIQQTAVKKFQ